MSDRGGPKRARGTERSSGSAVKRGAVGKAAENRRAGRGTVGADRRRRVADGPRARQTDSPEEPRGRARNSREDARRTGRGTGKEGAARPVEPPANVDVSLLDRAVRAELRSLSKPNADAVARHLVAAGQALDVEPATALAHARAARARAARVGAVREAVGIAAYRVGEWAEALTELRAARRISGDPRNLPVIADCERALGRAEQASRALSHPDARRLDPENRAELLIVVAGARRDLGQLDAALTVLARGGLDRERPGPGAARLWYAYADALEAAGRKDDAAQWFAASAALDADGVLDAAERAAALL